MSTWWQHLGEKLGEDFSGLTDPAIMLRLCVRLLLAVLLGGVVGYQREQTGKAAGVRTHMLVSLGAALLVLAGEQAGMAWADVSRIIQGIVTGIGFLGAGTILKKYDEGHIRGLTTAAGIWLTAAIGVAAGLGREAVAILGTLFAIVVLVLIPHVSATSEPPR
jgi:putative Mg2+ transporter-C (MgtC) family protein